MLIKVLLISIFLCLCESDAANDTLKVYRKLSLLNEQWMLKTSFPETAVLLQHPPYSYHAKGESTKGLLSAPEARGSAEDGSCSDDMIQIISNLESDWALQILDSDGKLSSGVLRGGIIWPGHFDECTSVYAPESSGGHGDFHGQYCVTSWSVNLGKKFPILPLTVGLCVPDSCKAENLLRFGRNIITEFDRLPFLKNVTALTLENVSCKATERTLDASAIIYIVFVLCFACLTLAGSAVTILDWRKSKQISQRSEQNLSASASSHPNVNGDINEAPKDGAKSYLPTHASFEKEPVVRDNASLTENAEVQIQSVDSQEKKLSDSVLKTILLCFSAFQNGAKVLNTDASEGQLMSIHGIRFLSLTWVILGHTYIMSISMIGNRIDVLKAMDSFSFQALLQSPFSVDSFFLLSGFLLAYLFLKEADKRRGKMNWVYFYVHRFWRLTPAYMVVVFFYLFVFKYMGSGPFWDNDHCDAERGSWWKYLIYINNFIPIHDMCVGWSWYLANDMQFCIISPLLLYPLWRWPVIGVSLLVAALIGTWTTIGVLSSVYDVIPMFVRAAQAKDFNAYAAKMWESFDLIYDKPYCRVAPYIIGIFLGFVLYKVNKRNNFLTWWQQALGWTLASFLSLSVVYGLYHVEMGKVTALFYNTLCRSSFSLGLAWVIFACETGHGGFITKLLSWKFWIPLSRLTYCAYLVHPILVHGYYMAHQTAFYFTQLVMVTNFMGFLLMSYGLAFIFSLTFESPLMNIEKLLLKSRSK